MPGPVEYGARLVRRVRFYLHREQFEREDRAARWSREAGDAGVRESTALIAVLARPKHLAAEETVVGDEEAILDVKDAPGALRDLFALDDDPAT